MVAATIGEARIGARRFYVWMAGACALIAIGGFVPSYWLQVPAGTFTGPPLVHVHAALFTAWPLLFLSQTWLESEGRLDHHRAWGLIGISLATAMLLVGYSTAIEGTIDRLAAGFGDRALGFLIVPASGATMFAVLVAAAVAFRRRTEVHRRLMVLATIAILQAPMARIFFVAKGGGGPGIRLNSNGPPPIQNTIGPALAIDLLIVAAIAYDWRTRGRPHPVYLIGLAAILAVQFARIPVSTSPQWLAFADGMVALAR